jgi:hypothetical protein
MLRLSQSHWLNLEQIIYVEDQTTSLEVTCNFGVANAFGHLEAYTVYLLGEERERLLAWLAHHTSVMPMLRPDNDDEPPF